MVVPLPILTFPQQLTCKQKGKVPYRPTDICPTAPQLCLIPIHISLPPVPTFFIFQMLSSVFTVYSISNVFPGQAWRAYRAQREVMKSHSLYQQGPRDHFICKHFHNLMRNDFSYFIFSLKSQQQSSFHCLENEEAEKREEDKQAEREGPAHAVKERKKEQKFSVVKSCDRFG